MMKKNLICLFDTMHVPIGIEEVINQAKILAYKSIYIPKNLRGKIKIIIKNNQIIISKT